jgi:hypothetical protein
MWNAHEFEVFSGAGAVRLVLPVKLVDVLILVISLKECRWPERRAAFEALSRAGLPCADGATAER